MTKQEYQSIRGEKDFLYRYFIKCGGSNIPQQTFAVFLNMWLMNMNVHPQHGIQRILNFLDEKFG